jgi:hypothetical protein
MDQISQFSAPADKVEKKDRLHKITLTGKSIPKLKTGKEVPKSANTPTSSAAHRK